MIGATASVEHPVTVQGDEMPGTSVHHVRQRGGTMSGTTEKAILAGGCFWGMQDLIRRRPGVLTTRVGYTGGDVPNATYRNHGTHAEAIEIIFDPEQISLPRPSGVLLPGPRPDDEEPPGQRPRPQLPVGHLLHQRRAEAGRGRHDRRRRTLLACGRGRLSPRWRRRGRSGRRSRSIRTTSSTIPTATRATSSGPTGSSRTGKRPSVTDEWPWRGVLSARQRRSLRRWGRAG